MLSLINENTGGRKPSKYSAARQEHRILYSQDDLYALLELRGSTPRRIVSDGFHRFWFEYEDRRLSACVTELVPLSQNQGDKAIAYRHGWDHGPAPEDDTVLFRDTTIDDIVIVRSVLWFSDDARLTFAGESFVYDSDGEVLARAGAGTEETLIYDLYLDRTATSHAQTLFLRDRQPELYGNWLGPGDVV